MKGRLLVLLCIGCRVATGADLDRTFLYDAEADTFVNAADPIAIYITGGTLIDGAGESVRPNSGILIRDGRFKSLNSTEVPSDAVQIDAADKWILPGLFDLHAHITYYRPSGSHAEDDVINAIRSERFLENYQGIGVTTVRDVASKEHVGYSMKRAQRMGLMGGARLYVSGPGITVTGGHPTELRPNEPPLYAVESDGPTMMRQSVRRAVKSGADFIKVLPPFTEEEIATVVDEARYWKLRVTAHVGGAQDLTLATPRRAVAAGVDSIEHLYSMGPKEAEEDLLREIKSENIYVIPTVGHHIRQLQAFDDSERAWMEEQISYSRESVTALLRRMHEVGIKLAVGTDSNARHMLTIRDIYLAELKGLSSGGLTEMEIIQAASLNAAEAMGLEEELGSIAENKIADLILVEEDPLRNLGSIVAPVLVIQGGEVVYERP